MVKISIRAFTLLEIMIVVLIMGLIVALTIPSFYKARRDTWKNTCFNNQRLIYEASAMYELRTENSLEGVNRDEIRQTLIDRNFIRSNETFECPKSDTDDYDDYRLIYENNNLTDINCFIDEEHVWCK